MDVTAHDVVEFWRQAGPTKWFDRSDAFDAQCGARFLETHFHAARREHDDWLASAEGALALVLLLDQIPRNVFRDSAHAYATDSLARCYAAHAVGAGFDVQVDPALRVFFYMPFEHSEAITDQETSLALHSGLAGAGADRWAVLHHGIIARFGRFPHRNAALGRETTDAESAFLDAGGFSG